MLEDWDAFSCQFILSFFMFLEISRNHLAALNARQATNALESIF